MLNATNGAIAGTPTKAGTFGFTAKVTDANKAPASHAETISISKPPMATITVVASPVTGGSVKGSGLDLVGAVENISAHANPGWTFMGWSDGGAVAHSIIVPTTNCTYTAHFIKNGTTLTEVVMALPHAQLNQPYAQTAAQAAGGNPPYAYTIETANGSPPIGIHLDASGFLSGTPSNAGTYTFGVCATDMIADEACKITTLVVDPVDQLTITKAGTGTGTVVANPPGLPPGLLYTNGTIVSLTATPANDGSTFTSWSGDAAGAAAGVQVVMNANKNVTATFDNPSAAFNGTWNSTQTYSSSDGTCARTITSTISLILTVTGGNVTGAGTENGIPCFNDNNCSVLGVPSVTGPVFGTVNGQTISIEFAGNANGGSCDGQSVTISFTATRLNPTTLAGTTGSGRAFTYSKQ